MKKALFLIASILFVFTLAGCAEERSYVYYPSIENPGFERGDTSGWTQTGDAFTVSEDANGTYSAAARYFLQGKAEGTGELVSGEFTLGNTGYVSFLIGAGEGDCHVDICEGDTVIKRIENPYFTDYTDDRMRRVLVDLRESIGKTIFIKIVDNCSDLMYSYINTDDFDVNVTETDLAVYKETGAIIV